MGCGCNYSGGAYSNATGKTEGMGNIKRGRAGAPWSYTGGGSDPRSGRSAAPWSYTPGGSDPRTAGRNAAPWSYTPGGSDPRTAQGSVEISAPNPPSNMVVTSSRLSSNPYRPIWVGYISNDTGKQMKSFDGGVLASQIEGYSNAAGPHMDWGDIEYGRSSAGPGGGGPGNTYPPIPNGRGSIAPPGVPIPWEPYKSAPYLYNYPPSSRRGKASSIPTRYLPPMAGRSSARPSGVGDIYLRSGQPYNPNPPITPTSGRSFDGGSLSNQILGSGMSGDRVSNPNPQSPLRRRGNREDFIG